MYDFPQFKYFLNIFKILLVLWKRRSPSNIRIKYVLTSNIFGMAACHYSILGILLSFGNLGCQQPSFMSSASRMLWVLDLNING